MLKFFWDWSPIGVLFFYFNSIWCKCPPFLRKTKFHLRGLSRMRAYVVCSLIYICIGTKSYFCCPLKYHSWSNHEHFIREKKEKRERLKEKYKMFLQWWSIKKLQKQLDFYHNSVIQNVLCINCQYLSGFLLCKLLHVKKINLYWDV